MSHNNNNNNNNSISEFIGPIADKAFSCQNDKMYPKRFLRFGSSRCYLPEPFKHIKQSIQDFQLYDDDVWICGFPKSGTTWISEMIWLLGYDLDYESAKVKIYPRIPHLEADGIFPKHKIQKQLNIIPGSDKVPTSSIELAKNMKSPRFIKTHLLWNLLPSTITTGEVQPKLIYIACNPKAVVVSYYHHLVHTEIGYRGSLDEFVEQFMANSVLYSPYVQHVKEFWERRHQNNILFLTYESMKKDLASAIQQTAKFLGKPELSEIQLQTLKEHLSFESMKANPYVNCKNGRVMELHDIFSNVDFIRKGKIDSWKEELKTEAIQALDKWIEGNKNDFI